MDTSRQHGLVYFGLRNVYAFDPFCGSTKQTIMESRKYTEPWSTWSALVPEEQEEVPSEDISSESAFLDYDNSQSFFTLLRSNGINSIPNKLWHLFTHKFEAKFLNGRTLEIEYNFDPRRSSKDRVLINLKSLLPVFGGIVPLGMDDFTSVLKMDDFVNMHVHLNKCFFGLHASCSCGTSVNETKSVEPFGKICLDGHVHHYCSEHVRWWLQCYLESSILLRESKESFDELIAMKYRFQPEHIVFFQTGNRATPEYLLMKALGKGNISRRKFYTPRFTKAEDR